MTTSPELPALWRLLADHIRSTYVDRGRAITISGAPGSGRALLTAHLATVCADDFEHVIHIDGGFLAVAERALRTELEAAGALDGPLTANVFAQTRSLLEKDRFLALIVDRASPLVMERLVGGPMGGVTIATTFDQRLPADEEVEVPPYPHADGWVQVAALRDDGLDIDDPALAPAPSAMGAMAALPAASLQALLKRVAPTAATGVTQVGLDDVLGHLMTNLSWAEKSVLSHLRILGPGRVPVAVVAAVVRGRGLRSNDEAAVRDALASLEARRLISGSRDAAILVPDPLNAALERRDQKWSQLRSRVPKIAARMESALTEPIAGATLDTAARVLARCASRRIDHEAVDSLRVRVVDTLVQQGLMVSAGQVLDEAIEAADRAGDEVRRAHNHIDRGLIADGLGRPGEALSHFEAALPGFGRSARHRRSQAMTLANIGRVHQQLGGHRDAIDALDRGRALLRRLDEPDPTGDVDMSLILVRSLIAQGVVHRAANELRQAATALESFTGRIAERDALQRDFAALVAALEDAEEAS